MPTRTPEKDNRICMDRQTNMRVNGKLILLLLLRHLKIALISAPVLEFFNPSKKTKVFTDASMNCLGAVLLQANDEIWKPVA